MKYQDHNLCSKNNASVLNFYNNFNSAALNDAGYSLFGAKISGTNIIINSTNSFVPMTLPNIERNELNSAANNNITIKDNGFYIIGFSCEIVSPVLNFVAELLVKNGSNNIVSQYVHILQENTAQNIETHKLIYLRNNETLSLWVKIKNAAIIFNNAALYCYKIDDTTLKRNLNLRHYWNLDETSSNRNDLIGNATLIHKNNPVAVLGLKNNAALFEATNFQALSNSNINIFNYEEGFTLSCWIKSNTSNGSSYLTFAARWKGDNKIAEDQYIFYYDYLTHKIIVTIRYSNGLYETIASKESLNLSNFINVAVTYERTTQFLRLYINGIISAAIKLKYEINGNSSLPFTVGAFNIAEDNAREYSDGIIDEFYISDRPYNHEEIDFIYNNGTGLSLQNLQQSNIFEQNNAGGGSLNLSIAATDVTYNGNSGLSSSNVQNALDEVSSIMQENAYFTANSNSSLPSAAGLNSVAIGPLAQALATNSIQIGQGINSAANTLKFRDTVISNSFGIQARGEINPSSAAPIGTIAWDNNNNVACFSKGAGVWACLDAKRNRYLQSLTFINWVLDVSNMRYGYTIYAANHQLTEPIIIQAYKIEAGIHKLCEVEIEIENTTKDIKLYVTAVPDTRFTGRVAIIGL